MPRQGPFQPPHAYAELRAEQPVARVRLWDGRAAWLVTRHAEIRQLLSDPRVSARRQHPGFPFATPARAAAERHEEAFISKDPPEHGRLRKMLTRYFAVRRIERLRPVVQDIVDGLIDDIEESGPPADLVRQLALELPARTICHIFGLPPEERHYFQSRDHRRNALDSDPADVVAATEEMLHYVDALVASKQRSPGDDLISELVRDQLDTGAAERGELVAILRHLLAAGHDTTANMIALGVVVLLSHPDQLAQATTDPELWPGAVEELLRYISVFQISPNRVATEDIEIAGVTIRTGDGIITPAVAANRDPHAFPDPDTFDIHRQARHHLAFAYGVHQCLGQPLARLELQVVFRTLFERLPTLELTTPAERLAVREYLLLSIEELPVTWTVPGVSR
ncbi:cytochrome P450 [Phytoactinopolyspora halotolerans]|uniref:Cytochrome P450 n=2 Tax=Phytoactinopolyspora halotolerans TaxID=1981512 RepID=A0A6L9SEB1_9ACTN|nr:cytochrome P450 [Phytoactinopolyspora halotolerans]